MSNRETLMVPHLVDIDALIEQSKQVEALVRMLQHYYENGEKAWDMLSDEVMGNYMWQITRTISNLQATIEEASNNQIPSDRLLDSTSH